MSKFLSQDSRFACEGWLGQGKAHFAEVRLAMRRVRSSRSGAPDEAAADPPAPAEVSAADVLRAARSLEAAIELQRQQEAAGIEPSKLFGESLDAYEKEEGGGGGVRRAVRGVHDMAAPGHPCVGA